MFLQIKKWKFTSKTQNYSTL